MSSGSSSRGQYVLWAMPSSSRASWKVLVSRSLGPSSTSPLVNGVQYFSGPSSTSSFGNKGKYVLWVILYPCFLVTQVSTSSGPNSTSPLVKGGQYFHRAIINLVLWKRKSVLLLVHPLPSLLGKRGQYVLWAMPSSSCTSWKRRSVCPKGHSQPHPHPTSSSPLGNEGQYVLWAILHPRFLETEVSISLEPF